VKLAKEKGITRSMAAVEIAAKEEGRKIFVLGNAPTALYKVMEQSKASSLLFFLFHLCLLKLLTLSPLCSIQIYYMYLSKLHTSS
ncbi:precorrin-8X methylmutase, partial [Clostridioides difficile]